jgi:hypothetical protein
LEADEASEITDRVRQVIEQLNIDPIPPFAATVKLFSATVRVVEALLSLGPISIPNRVVRGSRVPSASSAKRAAVEILAGS